MKAIKTASLAAVCAGMVMTSCHSSKPNNDNGPIEGNLIQVGGEIGPKEDIPLTGMRNYIPSAQVYRTNGDYINNVPIQTSADGKQLISFPAPSDITPDALPLQLANGYLLDRRGISPYNTKFTNYTYKEYAALKQAPSTQELLNAIIPGARVTDLVCLPFTTQEALADTTAVNKLIRTGFPGCKNMIEGPAEAPE